MIDEKDVQARLNRRLSGLSASQQRRDCIRTAINAEREEAQPMKRTIPRTLAFALVAMMLMATVALAERFNLFNFFGQQDERYAALAPHATLTMSDAALIEHPHLGQVSAAIDSAYFDGLSLALAYRIENPRFVEEYTPTAEELAEMQCYGPTVVAVDPNDPGAAVYQAYNAAVESGTPFGYRQYTIYPSDHALTDDGIDIPPYTATDTFDEQGNYCEIREFESPLPEALAVRSSLTVSIGLYQQEAVVWFDGTHTYMCDAREKVGAMEASIPMTDGSLRTLAGSGTIAGISLTAEAQVSKMAATLTLTCDAPLSTLLNSVPAGVEEHDRWVEVVAMDESGNKLRPQEGLPTDDRTSYTLSLLGTGTLPETLTVYAYPMWEGNDSPDLGALESIVLKITE